GLLNAREVDAALIPVIDLARFAAIWEIVSDACIGSDGPTLTVRIFSRVPPEEITALHVDGDSHTSVALAIVLWHELYQTPLQIRSFQPWEADGCQAVLLIGDKVVTHELERFGHEIDLGGAWQVLTGLPFVFATWTRRTDSDLGDLARQLSQARDRGLARAEAIAAQHGPAMGWTVELARRYLTENLSYTLSPRHRRGLETFLQLAAKWRLVPPATEVASV
ncbi:MAG: menaquinone biosynthetic enzyme MqnA/MqnD family protein, partial [Planctomycetota bacterium]